MRYPVSPQAGDVKPKDAARRLGLTLQRFEQVLPALLKRGFPPADVTTGLYDLDAVDAWRRARNPHIFGLTLTASAVDARSGIVDERLENFDGG